MRSNCLPLDALDYYWMTDFIEAILDTVHQNILQKVPPWCWQDLYRVCGKLSIIMDRVTALDYLSVEAEKIRISAAFNTLIHTLCKEAGLILCISNIQWMDLCSFNCLKHALFKNLFPPMTLVLTGKENDTKLIELQRYFSHSKFIVFYSDQCYNSYRNER
ncbi:hypothetical protein SAMN02745975_01444 [Geosporobacter subterraneus DSM 17957]|uniref:Uncharacterized protein n=1 Tax=Geosporobacter subterraneus DSM 17957 TaxID=1121919 RepID=A0A1M6H575_9FIRM|nr:hypothetical protein SAMN02745975_01444 [Geosporobacter subterraneus DSM 17957]